MEHEVIDGYEPIDGVKHLVKGTKYKNAQKCLDCGAISFDPAEGEEFTREEPHMKRQFEQGYNYDNDFGYDCRKPLRCALVDRADVKVEAHDWKNGKRTLCGYTCKHENKYTAFYGSTTYSWKTKKGVVDKKVHIAPHWRRIIWSRPAQLAARSSSII